MSYQIHDQDAICSPAELEVLHALEGIPAEFWPDLDAVDGWRWEPTDDDYRPEPEPFHPTPEDERQAVLMLNARSESCRSVPPSAFTAADVEFPDNPLW